MKNKAILVVTLILLALMLPSVMAVSTSTFVTPTDDGVISGETYVFNVTTDMAGMGNCSISGSSAASGDSFSFFELLTPNAATTEAEYTYNSSLLEDAADWVIIGNCTNSSVVEPITSVTGVVVDNTVPTAPSSITPTTASSKSSISIAAVVVDAVTTGCTMTLTSSFTSQSFTMDYSGTACTDTISLPGSGDYQLTVTATDGTNTTSATAQALKVEENNGGITTYTTSSSTGTSSDKTRTFVIVAAIAVVLYMLYTQGAGKGKRRSRRRR